MFPLKGSWIILTSPVAHWRFQNHNFRNKLNKPHVVNAHGSVQTWFNKQSKFFHGWHCFWGFASWIWIYCLQSSATRLVGYNCQQTWRPWPTSVSTLPLKLPPGPAAFLARHAGGRDSDLWMANKTFTFTRDYFSYLNFHFTRENFSITSASLSSPRACPSEPSERPYA